MLTGPGVAAVARRADGEVLVDADGEAGAASALGGVLELAIELELDPAVEVDLFAVRGSELGHGGRRWRAIRGGPFAPRRDGGERFVEGREGGERGERVALLGDVAVVGRAPRVAGCAGHEGAVERVEHRAGEGGGAFVVDAVA